MATAKTKADTYLEVGFTSAAGTLVAGQSVEIQLRIVKDDWSNYTQSDDYSFLSAATAYTDQTLLPAYLSGSLAWGLEP
ncbi:Xyloglucanase precursor [compost metagenome]